MKNISIVLCGEAGQGIQTVEKLFTKIVKKAGYDVFSTKEYMSRVRGGSNSTEIRISIEPVRAYIDRIDFFIPLSLGAIEHIEKRITKNTIVIGKKEHIKTKKDCKSIEVSFSRLAIEIGDIIFSNTVAVGLLSSICNVDKKVVNDLIEKYFIKKSYSRCDLPLYDCNPPF